MSFSYRSETRELNDEARRLKAGSFVQLLDGVTHYELSNPSQDQTVVLVHGFSVPYFIYDPTFQFLSENNFRVLRYDLFGRGFSDRPDTKYNIDLFVRQLEDLLDTQHLTGSVSLIGLSMGGPITATFTARHPQRVEKLVLIDPAGARQLFLSKILRIAAAPVIGETILSLVGNGGIVRKIASDSLEGKLDKHFQERYLEQIQYKGFRHAILSTIRNHVLDSCIDIYRNVGSMKKPALLIWGRHDTIVPLSHSDDLRAAIPGIEFHIIEDCSHIPHYEKPAETNAMLLEFLRK
ncbi:MAG TPA: alpha/beta hydrolase [Anaerolineales bacterium]|nr:alpha/beta hydrolase [Anaerolineales bacterium]